MVYDYDEPSNWIFVVLFFWATMPFWAGLITGVLAGKCIPHVGGFDGVVIGGAVGFTINAIAVIAVILVLVSDMRIPFDPKAYFLAPVAALVVTGCICWWNGRKVQGDD